MRWAREFSLKRLIPKALATPETTKKYSGDKGSRHRVVNTALHQLIFIENVIAILYNKKSATSSKNSVSKIPSSRRSR